MIKAAHTLIYSDDPEATRAFLRDVVRWPFVEDARSGSGWLIFRTGPGELGVHPTRGSHEGRTYSHPRHHRFSLICDDVAQTMAELAARGAEFSSDIQDMGFGLAALMKLPGADDLLLYQPLHPTAYDLPQ